MQPSSTQQPSSQQRARYLFYRLAMYALFLGALILVLVVDANAEQAKFFENSLTERAQEAILLLLVLGMFYASTILHRVSNLAFVFSGFFLVCLIRELDALLEQNIGSGTWQLLVTLVLAGVLYRVKGNWSSLVTEFRINTSTYNFGLFAAGFLITFIFSRLIGSEELWMAVMEEGYQRNVKNAVEESVELLGYAVLLFAGVEFYAHHARSASSSDQG